MSDSAYANVTRAEDLFRDLAWRPMVELAKTALFASASWLNVWPVKPILGFMIDQFSSRLFEAIRLGFDLQLITFLNQEHKHEYDKAAVRLRIVAHDHGIDSEQFKAEKEKAKDALARFVRFGATI